MLTSLINRATSYGEKLRVSSETLNNESAGRAYAALNERYKMLEAYYSGEVYNRADAMHPTIQTWAGFPKAIRPISLMFKRSVDFWPGQVYPGAWTSDGMPSSNGRPNKIPYDVDTPDELRACVQQAYSWANGAQFLSRKVHLGAKLGDVFAEVHVHWGEEPRSHKVYPVLIHPKHVIRLELNERGDVKSYRLAIPRWDEASNRSYLWGKEVTRERVTYYWDDEEHSYVDGQPASVPNEWTFVPAVWVPHQAMGGIHGAPAMDGIIPTLDEYQGILASVDDYLHKFVRQGVIIETNDTAGLTTFLGSQQPSLVTDMTYRQAQLQQERDRQQINIMPAPEGTRVHHLIQNLGLGEAETHIARIAREIEDALPEIVFAERLQSMDQVTGPGARALVSRVQQKLDDVCGNYDNGTIKLGQMCAAMGGELIRTNQWGLRSQLTPQQQRFVPFNLDSYQKSELDFGLTPRELVPKTTLELAQEAVTIESIQTATGLRHIGFSDEEIYGTDEQGKSLAPGADETSKALPGILEATGPQIAANVGNALVQSFNAGLSGV
jgi:hypothetical protein